MAYLWYLICITKQLAKMNTIATVSTIQLVDFAVDIFEIVA